MKRKAHAVSAEDIKQFVKMYTHGYTLEQIAEVTGWGPECIRRNLIKAGIHLYHPGERRSHT